MKLKKYDGKCVRIVDVFDDVFEGYCTYNSSEYNEHEYGREDDSLQILNIVFYEDIIKSIKIIDGFTTSYSKLEEAIAEDIDCIEDVLLLGEDSDDEHIYRLLVYLKDYINNNKLSNSFYEKLNNYLVKYLKYNNKLSNEVTELIELLKRKRNN